MIRYIHSESNAVLNPRNCPLKQQQRKGVGVADNNKNGDKKLAPKFVSARDERISGEGFDLETDSSVVLPSACLSDEVKEWKRKFTMLLLDKEKELISREKKDWRDSVQIAAPASKTGLHSKRPASKLHI